MPIGAKHVSINFNKVHEIFKNKEFAKDEKDGSG